MSKPSILLIMTNDSLPYDFIMGSSFFLVKENPIVSKNLHMTFIITANENEPQKTKFDNRRFMKIYNIIDHVMLFCNRVY